MIQCKVIVSRNVSPLEKCKTLTICFADILPNLPSEFSIKDVFFPYKKMEVEIGICIKEEKRNTYF